MVWYMRCSSQAMVKTLGTWTSRSIPSKERPSVSFSQVSKVALGNSISSCPRVAVQVFCADLSVKVLTRWWKVVRWKRWRKAYPPGCGGAIQPEGSTRSGFQVGPRAVSHSKSVRDVSGLPRRQPRPGPRKFAKTTCHGAPPAGLFPATGRREGSFGHPPGAHAGGFPKYRRRWN